MEENFSFKFEPRAPVGNEFHARWGQDCNKEDCLACFERLYHYYEDKTLHIWVDTVSVRWVISAGDFFAYADEVVLHSDYTLEQLKDHNDKPAYSRFIQNLQERSLNV